MAQYADIMLPLALAGTFTYRIPQDMAARLDTGCRVVVQFGAKRYYTGIVVRLHDDAPQPGIAVKDISAPADAEPVLTAVQMKFWQWIAYYYMCTPGEVMKAALPAGLRADSDTMLVRNAGFDSETQHLTARDRAILQILETDKGCKLGDVERKLKAANLLPAVKRLMETGAVSVSERMSQGFKPRTETHVRLCETYFDEEALNALFPTLKRAPAQEALLLRYLDLSKASAALVLKNVGLLEKVSRAALCETTASAEAALAALRKKGVLETYDVVTRRLRTPLDHLTAEEREHLGRRKEPDERQRQAVERIHDIFKEKNVCLLHGVTSSGKTEVYMTLIEQTLAQGKQVLYLVPEIALTTQLTTRLGRVFGAVMGVYHSKFPDNERVELWRQQLGDNAFPLILGVRSAVFLPFRNLGLVIVDEEHETSYKQQDPAPRYHARDAAIVLAGMTGAKVLLGTATPSMESYHNAMTGKYGLVEMPTRYGNVAMPEIVVEDVKELRRKKLMKTPFSPRLTDEVRTALDGHEQAILFQNRRGYSPVLECRTCGWTPRCTKCDVSLTFHQKTNRLMCHYCGSAYAVPVQCPNCGDTELRDLGYGTEKIEAAAQSVFPAARTERMDLDTTGSRTAHEQIIARFQRGDTDLLIGTQMVTKGLDFDRVHVVGILNADQMLNIPDFRAYERAYQMMSQVAGRAGRRGKRGLVVLQTKQPDLPVVRQIVEGDYKAMYRDQIEERTLFRFPPACRLINMVLKHRDEAVADHAAKDLAGLLAPHFPGCLLGPDRPVVSRIQRLHIRLLTLKVLPELTPQHVRRTLTAARDALLGQAAYKGVIFYFDVDP